MALQSPFFGKRDNETGSSRTGLNPGAPGNPYARPLASGPTGAPAPAGAANTSAGTAANAPAMTQEATATSVAPAPSGGVPASKLTVGPKIKLKGVEITDCDTLVVEGSVEATMDSRVMQIAEQGAFNGSAQIDIAEIHGAFDGDLTVRERLVIYPTGKVSGKVRYGKLVIEEGGQLSGDVALTALQ